ncbi:Dihydrolipoyl dehydrogenase [Nitrospira tepida]|uniref:Dihydrolipoyl dehydrogenase n=1 Tax=Nitrospira tepida TaxID=2973512 RepID=A0AA86N062_9BACT|nr:dihydrolipoyl dehydrogenase [Nitrospira tepida]CAI4032290.1 Dihydrolipoyl dehydrogenase [Nitrospira tepida]
MSSNLHIVIIGAGPGGYVAAIRAAQLGATVTVVDREALGGVCLNWGCIPSKALLSVVDLGDKAKKAADLGLSFGGPATYDLARMVARKNKVVTGLVKGIATLFKHWNINYLEGTARLLDARTVHVALNTGGEQQISADAILLATGSSWPNLPLFPIDGKRILTSREALELTERPSSLLIVGAGVEGCEFASLFSGLGTQVIMVELLSRILPLEDEEISTAMDRELRKRGVTIHTGTQITEFQSDDSVLTAILADGTPLSAEKLLVSVGRGFNSKGIGLEQAGVALGRRGEILVNERLETSVPGIYAIGDVTGKAMLAHVASAQGKVAVENALGQIHEINYNVIPAGIFTLPEIGRVGLTEQQARERAQSLGQDPDKTLKVGRFRYAGLGKAQAVGDTAGFYKIISEAESGRILGAHIMGAHAADLIHEAALAMEVGASVAQLARMIHAHPTLAEGLMEAAEDVDGLAIHLARKKA